jgi:hypothetical protein
MTNPTDTSDRPQEPTKKRRLSRPRRLRLHLDEEHILTKVRRDSRLRMRRFGALLNLPGEPGSPKTRRLTAKGLVEPGRPRKPRPG